MEKIFRRFCMCLAVGAGVCMILSMGMEKKALAASATIEIEASDTQICVGDSFYIIITVESEAAIGDVDAYFTYDDKRLEFLTGGSIASEENKLIHIKDKISDVDYTKKYSVEMKARKRGNVEIALISPFKILDATDGTSMSASSNRLSLYIAKEGSAGTEAVVPKPGDGDTEGEPEEPGGGSGIIVPELPSESGMPGVVNKKGARLESLSASPQLLSPEFQPKHYRYTTTVAADVTELELLYTTYEEDSYVEVIGNGDFVTGRNLVKIKVTGADGYTKTYKITVTRAAEEPEGKQPESGAGQNGEEEEGITVHSHVTKVYTDDEYQNTVTRLKLIIGILTAFSLFLLVIVLSLVLRLKGYREDGLDDV